MATLAVDAVIGFLKQKLPAELSGQLDSLLSGQESSSGILGAVKGLFGKKDRILLMYQKPRTRVGNTT
jgi:hypothetical protein